MSAPSSLPPPPNKNKNILLFHTYSSVRHILSITFLASLSRGSSVSIVTSYSLDEPEFGSWQGREFSRLQNIQTTSGTHSSSFSVDVRFLNPGAKRPRSDAGYSCPSREEVKNEWRYTSSPPKCLHGVDRDNFNFDLNVLWISCTGLLVHTAVRFGMWIFTCRRVIQLPSPTAAVC